MADISKVTINGTTYNIKDTTARSSSGVTSVNGNTGAVTINVPSKVSDLTNDSGYLTLSTLPIYDGSVT